MSSQAGAMLHLEAGRLGLLRSLVSGTALGPSTTWGPPSDRHLFIVTNGNFPA